MSKTEQRSHQVLAAAWRKHWPQICFHCTLQVIETFGRKRFNISTKEASFVIFKHRNRGVLDLGRMSESIQPALCKFSSTRIFQLPRFTFIFLLFMSSAKVYQRIGNSLTAVNVFLTLHHYKIGVKRTFFVKKWAYRSKLSFFVLKTSTFLPAFMTWNKWRTPQFHDTLFDRKAERLTPRHVKALCKFGHLLLMQINCCNPKCS